MQETSVLKTGRGGGIRTPDILLPKQARYQTALHPDVRTRRIAQDSPKLNSRHPQMLRIQDQSGSMTASPNPPGCQVVGLDSDKSAPIEHRLRPILAYFSALAATSDAPAPPQQPVYARNRRSWAVEY